jgi:hypothetical protein
MTMIPASSRPTSLMTGVITSPNSTDAEEGQVSIVASLPGGADGADNVRSGDDGKFDDKVAVSANLESNDDKLIIDFLEDEKKHMTYGRRIALSLMDKSWYNPMAGQKDDDNGDSNDDVGNNNNKDVAGENFDDAREVDNSDLVEKDNNHDVMKEASIDPNITARCIMDDFDEDNKYEKPDLRKGWAYFEHVALNRYLVLNDIKNKPKEDIFTRGFRTLVMNANKKFDRAEAGEDDVPTRLYSPIWTPHKQLGDFGLGVGLYFSTLRAIIVITFFCGLCSLYNILYFASAEYDPADNSTGWIEQGSAVCSTTSWVPCPTCDCIDTNESFTAYGLIPPQRCAISENENGSKKLLFALKNGCDGTHWQLAATNFGTVLFMVFAVMLLGVYMRREEIQFDEDEQTAQDYSIQITNPPGDAKDPEEWRRYFKENCDGAQVTVCTCAVHNDLLVKTLVERRERIRAIQSIQPGESMDTLDLARVAAETERGRRSIPSLLAMVAPGIPEHFSRLVALNAKVEGLSQLNYPVTNIFVTFETEEDQRHVLEKLTVGSAKSSKNDTSALSDPKYLFRGKYVLSVCEPEEPNAIIWENLNVGWAKRLKELFLTSCFTLATIVLVAYLVYLSNNSEKLEKHLASADINMLGSAVTISIFNAIFPSFAKILTNMCESHRSESSRQSSLYYKIALFRWVISAVVIFIITPFTATLDTGNGQVALVPQVYALFFSDMIITNLISLADPVSLNRIFI